jgi:hypothetical protein
MKHRLVAPRGLTGSVEFATGESLHIPPSGVVEIEDSPEYEFRGDFEPRQMRQNLDHLAILLKLGFQHAPAAGGAADRPEGRFEGEAWFDTAAHRPLWWSAGAWRDAGGNEA